MFVRERKTRGESSPVRLDHARTVEQCDQLVAVPIDVQRIKTLYARFASEFHAELAIV